MIEFLLISILFFICAVLAHIADVLRNMHNTLKEKK